MSQTEFARVLVSLLSEIDYLSSPAHLQFQSCLWLPLHSLKFWLLSNLTLGEEKMFVSQTESIEMKISTSATSTSYLCFIMRLRSTLYYFFHSWMVKLFKNTK